jgi:hypothetical protein
MGFQFAQNLDTRYIHRNGTLMSHRASLGGLGGQLDGEFETRYKMIKRKVDFLDVVAAERMGITLKAYKFLILNEYWVHGFDAVKANAADKQVLLKCNKNLNGTIPTTYNTQFGKVVVHFSECPLIKKPMKIGYGKMTPLQKKDAKALIKQSIFQKEAFIRDVIKTDKYLKLFNVK